MTNSSDHKLKAMFVVSFESYLSALSSLAQEGLRSGSLEPLLYFPSTYQWIEREQRHCQAAGLRFFFAGQPEKTPSGAPSFTMRAWRKARSTWKRSFFGEYLAIISKRRSFRKLLRQLKPEILVFGGDITGHKMAIMMAAGHDLGIKSVILPSWMAGPEEPAANISHAKEYWVHGLNKVLAKTLPRWFYNFKGKELVKLPWRKALALELNGLAPPQPWILHSGLADEILLESQFMLHYGERLGLPADKMKVLGSPAHDRLHALSRNPLLQKEKICAGLGLHNGSSVLLMALPPNFVAARRQSGFDSYEEVIEAFLAPAKKFGSQYITLLSLHPSCNPNDFQHLEGPSLKIFRGSILEAIPVCDLFVASISSTIQWAAACGKPVLNYDLYHFHYSDYMQHKGILFVDDAASYSQALKALLEDRDFLEKTRQTQESSAPQFGRLDGLASSRLIERLRHLARD